MDKENPNKKGAAPDQENAPSETIQQADYKAINSRSTSTEAQEAKALALLRCGPQTTYSLRKNGIAHPAGRIKSLRGRGNVISTERVTAVDSDGFLHVKAARYSLVQEAPEQQELLEVANG